MSDFLSNLAARSLGTSEVIRPRTPSLYEPYRADSGPRVARSDFRSPETEREPQREASLLNDDHAAHADVGISKPKAEVPRPLWRDDKQAAPIPQAESADRAEGMQPEEPAAAAMSPPEEARSHASPAAVRAAEAKAAPRFESSSSPIPTPDASAPAVRAVRASRDETGPLPIGSEGVVGHPRPSEGPRGDLSRSHLPSGEPITPATELPAGAATRSAPWARETFRPTAAPHSGMAKIPDDSRPLEDNKSARNSVLGSPQQSIKTQSHPFGPRLRSEEGTSPPGEVWRNSAESEADRLARRTGFPQLASGRIQPEGSPGHSAGFSAGIVRPPVGSRSEARIAAAARGSNRSEAAIHVTIGSVEVRAVFPEKPAHRAPSTRPKPTVSLDDYLKRSGGGSR